MSDTDNDEIEIIEAPTDGATPEPDAPEEIDELAQLKAKLDEERAARLAAESRTAALEASHGEGQTRLKSEIEGRLGAEERATESMLTAASSALVSAKAEFVKANEEGRFADAAELAERISDAKNQVNGANYRKAQLADIRKRAEDEAANKGDSGETGNTEENFIKGLSAPSQDWFRRHPAELRRAVAEPAFFDRIVRADNLAYGSGIDRDTPEYFDFVEQKLGLKDAGSEARTERRAKSNAGATAAAAAGNRRSTGAVSAGRTVHLSAVVSQLTPAMREAAFTSNPKLPEDEALEIYARGLVKQKAKEPGFAPEIKI